MMNPEEIDAQVQEEFSTGPLRSSSDRFREEQHTSVDQLQKQQEASGQSQGIRQALQHGSGTSQRDVD